MLVRQIDWIEPIDAARRLVVLPRLSLLDSAMGHPTLGRWSVLAADPFGTFVANGGTAVWNGEATSALPLDALRERLGRYALPRDEGLPPFTGGAIGAFAYELGWALEGREPPHPRIAPDIDLAFYDVVAAFDHVERRCWLLASGHPEATVDARRARAAARCDAFAARLAAPVPPSRPPAPLDWRPIGAAQGFRDGVERVRDFIRAGDIYQANIAHGYRAALPEDCDPLALYAELRLANPAPYSAFLGGLAGGAALLSTSPELFLRCDGCRVETRPIKGTARRHADPAADRRAAAALIASPKDRAENVMIVDLLRNDLARVCEPASVAVPALCRIESYSGLHHLVSAVTGTLAPGRDALDLVAASFPGGSITGAPKLRAMEVIAAIEGRARGGYCGSIGSLGFDGSLDLNIAIRTIALRDGMAELRVGGGITALSDPQAEYEETLTKARRLTQALAPLAAAIA